MLSQVALKRINAKRKARAEQAERGPLNLGPETWRFIVRNEVTTEIVTEGKWTGSRSYAAERAATALFDKAHWYEAEGFQVQWSMGKDEWTARAGLQVFKGWAFQEHFKGQEA